MYGKTLFRDENHSRRDDIIVTIIKLLSDVPIVTDGTRRLRHVDGGGSATVLTDPYRTQPVTSTDGQRFPALRRDQSPPMTDREGTLFLSRVKISRHTCLCVCELTDRR